MDKLDLTPLKKINKNTSKSSKLNSKKYHGNRKPQFESATLEILDGEERDDEFAITGTGETRYRRDLRELRQKLRQKEHMIDASIEKANYDSNMKLNKRNKIINRRSEIENHRIERVKRNTEVKTKFLINVDKAVESKLQNRLVRLYHKKHIENLMPEWTRTLALVENEVNSRGHNDKLKWRSHASKWILKSIEESKNDEYATNSRLKLLKINREINLVKANELIRMINDLKKEYINGREEGITKFSHHRDQLVKAEENKKLHDNIVPLPSSKFKENLAASSVESSKSIISSNTKLTRYTQSTIDDISLGTSRDISEDFTLPSFDYMSTLSTVDLNDELKPDKLKGEGFGLFNGDPNKSLNFRDDAEQEKSQAMVNLRHAAAKGNFQVAWSIFKKKLDPITADKCAYRGGRPVQPLLVTYKLLMMAVKNSEVIEFEYADKVINHLLDSGRKPDIQLYNMMISACVRESRWRRALNMIEEMYHKYDIVPTPFSLTLLLDCCRHTLEEPSIIFETLRHAEFLPAEFCRTVSLLNIDARVPPQVVKEAMYDVAAMTSDSQLPIYPIGKTFSEPSQVSLQTVKKPGRIREFTKAMRDTLAMTHPAKFSFGKTALAFDNQIAKAARIPGIDYYANESHRFNAMYKIRETGNDNDDKDDVSSVGMSVNSTSGETYHRLGGMLDEEDSIYSHPDKKRNHK